ncbi:MAG: type IV secretion system DNA-binding domain-containing protein [Thermoleophilia bacterium]|nr:type IV secretion system DNA-binding domain-containing protein [Thermoleophilia bacterium]
MPADLIPVHTLPWQEPGVGDIHPSAEEVSFAALRLVAADWWQIDSLADVTAQISRFAGIAEIAAVPGRVVVFTDIVAGRTDGPPLEVHLGMGCFGAVGATAGQVRELARVARTVLQVPPAIYAAAFVDPLPLFTETGPDCALICQSVVQLADEEARAECISRFDHHSDPWVQLADTLIGFGARIRLRTTLLAAELSDADQLYLNEQLREADVIAERAGERSTLATRAGRLAATLVDVAESFSTPVFRMEVALAAASPMNDLFLRAVASAITDERDVDRTQHHPGRADPLVSYRRRLVGGYEIERPGPSLLEALGKGVPLHGGMRDGRLRDLASLTEVAFACHWPVPAGAPLPGVATHSARQMAPLEPVLVGPVIGEDADGRPARIPEDRGHIHASGVTGTGKSTLLVGLTKADLDDKTQFVAIDPHSHYGQLALAEARVRRVGVAHLHPDDPKRTRIKLLEGASRAGVTNPAELDASVSRIIEAVTSHLPPLYTGPVFESTSRAGILVLIYARPPRPILDLARLLSDADFVSEVLEHNDAPDWAKVQVEAAVNRPDRGEMVGYVSSKYLKLFTGGLERVIEGPDAEGSTIRDLIDGGRSLVVTADKGRLGGLGASFLGHIVLAGVIDAALRRPPNQRPPLHVYVDEIHAFPAVNLERGFAEGRKFGLRITAAHQHLSQLSPSLQDCLLGNATTRVVFRSTPEDAARLAPLIDVPPTDIARLPNLRAYVHHAGGHPYSVRLEPPPRLEAEVYDLDVETRSAPKSQRRRSAGVAVEG